MLGLFWECFGTCLEHVWNSLNNVWKMFGKILEQSIQESKPKIRGPNSSWERLGQKAKPGPTKNRYKFQTNNAACYSAPPRFWVVVLKLIRFFEGLGFYGFFLGILAHRKKLFSKEAEETVFPNAGPPKDKNLKRHPKSTFSANLFSKFIFWMV